MMHCLQNSPHTRTRESRLAVPWMYFQLFSFPFVGTSLMEPYGHVLCVNLELRPFQRPPRDMIRTSLQPYLHIWPPDTTVCLHLVLAWLSTSFLQLSTWFPSLVFVIALTFHFNFLSPGWIYTLLFHSCNTHGSQSARWITGVRHGSMQTNSICMWF